MILTTIVLSGALGLAARGESLAAFGAPSAAAALGTPFDGRCIPKPPQRGCRVGGPGAGCVAPRSNTPGITTTPRKPRAAGTPVLGRPALPEGRGPQRGCRVGDPGAPRPSRCDARLSPRAAGRRTGRPDRIRFRGRHGPPPRDARRSRASVMRRSAELFGSLLRRRGPAYPPRQLRHRHDAVVRRIVNRNDALHVELQSTDVVEQTHGKRARRTRRRRSGSLWVVAVSFEQHLLL